MNTPDTYIKKLHPHRISFFSFYFLGVIFIIGGFVLQHWYSFAGFLVVVASIGIIILAEILRGAETFYVLDGGVERTFDLLSTSREFISYDKIQDLDVGQGIVQRMFGIGNLAFDTAGTTKVELRFYAVADPYGIEKIIREKMSRPTPVEHVAPSV